MFQSFMCFQVRVRMRPGFVGSDDIVHMIYSGKGKLCDVRHEKTDPNVFVVVIPKEGWARPRAPILRAHPSLGMTSRKTLRLVFS